MATAQLIRDTATQDAALVRALSSITLQQAETVIRALQACSQVWEVQTINDYNGYLAVLIEPRTLGNDMPAYFIAGTRQNLELLKVCNDDLSPIATFNEIGDLSAELMGLIV